jgi:plastocyanin
LAVALVLPALITSACASDSKPRGAAPAGDLTIVEKDYRFDPETIRAPIGRELVVVIDNRDQRVGHNVRFPTLDGHPATKIETGPGYQTLTLHFDQPGGYPFVCDLHPTMKGTVVAS